MKIEELVGELEKLNSGAVFVVAGNEINKKILSSVPLEKLALPDGYTTDGYGIKFKKGGGRFGQYEVEFSEGLLKNNELLEPKNIRKLVKLLEELNSGVDFYLYDPDIYKDAAKMIYCSVPGENLILPPPLYWSSEGITNKHNTASGGYRTISVLGPNNLCAGDENILRDLNGHTLAENIAAASESVDATNGRKHTILRRKKSKAGIDEKNRAAIMAGLCILGVASAIVIGKKDAYKILKYQLNILESIGTSLLTLVSIGAGAFLAKYFKDSVKFKKAHHEYMSSLGGDNTNEIGGNNGKTR